MLSKMESEETQKKIAQLQSLEQNLQNFLMQKQTFQSQLIEIENALDEIEKSSGNVYKIVGSVMISSKKDDIKKDLNDKKEIVSLRISNLEKQEEKIKDKASKLQKEVLSEVGADRGEDA
ncbi:MAG: prefoldin beta subunit [archaeon GW2011_AR18]|nr:MAG: prefoldin beta subunit [archaeon GW2011_AR18]